MKKPGRSPRKTRRDGTYRTWCPKCAAPYDVDLNAKLPLQVHINCAACGQRFKLLCKE